METHFNIGIDLEKSHGSYIFDKYTHTEFLDYFGMYSSLVLGYNHPIFDDNFERKVSTISKIRLAMQVFVAEEMVEFVEKFRKYVFSDYLHFTCTGSLAIESAIKCAMEYRKIKEPMVLGLKKAFHGINGWGFITDRYGATIDRIINFPENNWENLSLLEMRRYIENENTDDLIAVVIEPILCTVGDIYLDIDELSAIRNLCSEKDICFIVDEIQTGFGVTGEMWYSDSIGLNPDVLVFGKKAQICGIVAKEKYNECMITPLRKLDVTFNGDLIDAIRAGYVLAAYEEYDLINKANENSLKFAEIISGKVLNYRTKGHLIAFDFETKDQRDKFVQNCYENRLLVNTAEDRTIRMRPNMAVSQSEIDHLADIIEKIL